ncbi:MAG: NAD(P)-dependent oxidoreductase [Phycisphaeraceae bacterium]|nr:NAD(P)-dependent oxidoreductase [Phycisphaeraceae bacterium]
MTDIKPQLGYIGLGIMGLPMARNLMNASYAMTIWNRTPEKGQPLVERGAELADSPADLAKRGPAVIFINVTDTPDVEAVLFGDNGLASAAKPGTIIVDHSTISPDATRDFAKRLAEQGIDFLDAPVSGGDIGAQQGTLSIMVGGRDGAVQTVMPMLEVVGKSVIHLGEAGLGQTCKACNQIAGMVTLLGVCEALALAQQSGLEMGKMIQAVGGGAAGSWQLTNLGPKIAAGDHDPGFMIDLVNKDLAIVLDAAERAGVPLQGTAQIADLFKQVAAQGGGRLGTQAVAKAIESAGGFSFND